MPNLVDYHISRLKDKNPVVRIKAAQELALLGDPAALDALALLFRTDTDSSVRRAAQEAGRILFEKQQAENERQSG